MVTITIDCCMYTIITSEVRQVFNELLNTVNVADIKSEETTEDIQIYHLYNYIGDIKTLLESAVYSKGVMSMSFDDNRLFNNPTYSARVLYTGFSYATSYITAKITRNHFREIVDDECNEYILALLCLLYCVDKIFENHVVLTPCEDMVRDIENYRLCEVEFT